MAQNVSFREDFRVKSLTVVDDMLTSCFANIATTLSMAEKARKEYDTGRTVSDDETKNYLFTVSFTI